MNASLNVHPFRSTRTRCDKATIREGGFSLVEVAMAIAIVAFAFISLYGLLPAGLSTFRQSMDTTVGSQIVQRLVNEAQQTDYSLLVTTTPVLRFFDDQGGEVTAQEISEGKDYLYTAQVTVKAPTVLPNTSTPATESLATVVVRLAPNPTHDPNPFVEGGTIHFTTSSALIAKNQ